MSFRLSQRSRERLKGVHPDLVAVVEGAILLTPVDFMVTEGLRTPARQAELVFPLVARPPLRLPLGAAAVLRE